MFILTKFNSITRNPVVETFKTHKAAWLRMQQHLTTVQDAQFAESYKNNADWRGYVDSAPDYGISENSAWANCSDVDYNWSIREM